MSLYCVTLLRHFIRSVVTFQIGGDNMKYDKLSFYDKYIYDQYMILLNLRDVIENCEEYVEYHPSLKLQLELKEVWAKIFSDDIDRIFSNR